LIGLDLTGDVGVRPGDRKITSLINSKVPQSMLFVDGSIEMTSPHHLWDMDSKFVFNGVVSSCLFVGQVR